MGSMQEGGSSVLCLEGRRFEKGRDELSLEDVPDAIVAKILRLAEENAVNIRLVCTAWWRAGVVLSLAPKVFHKALFRGKNNSFASLQFLDLSRSTGVTDQKLALLAELPQLTGLKLKRCRDVSDVGLMRLGELQKLEDLNLARCLNISDSGIVRLAATAKRLRALNIKFCYKITDRGIQALANLQSLRLLNCSHCRHVSDQGMLGLAGLPMLQVLKISDCDQITDYGMEAIGSLTSLTSLHTVVERTLEQQKTDLSLRIIGGKLLNLATLKISFGEHMSIEGAQALTGLSGLKELKLGRVSIPTDELFPLLGQMETLESLKIDRCGGISVEGMRHLGQLQHLCILGLKASVPEAEFSDSAVEELTALGQLQELSISSFRGITGCTLQMLTGLQKLQLINCQSIDDSAMTGLMHLQNLRCLSLCSNPGIKDEAVPMMAEARLLETITLCDCVNITGKTFGPLASLTRLVDLTVSFCQTLCDEGMEEIAHIPNLTHLSIAMCQHVTDRGIQALCNGGMKSLRHLNAAGCDLVTVKAFHELQVALPQLAIEKKSLHPSLINVLGNSVI